MPVDQVDKHLSRELSCRRNSKCYITTSRRYLMQFLETFGSLRTKIHGSSNSKIGCKARQVHKYLLWKYGVECKEIDTRSPSNSG